MVAPPRPLIESKMSKQLTKILKSNVGIRSSSKNLSKKFVIPSHTLKNLPRVIIALARKKRFKTDKEKQATREHTEWSGQPVGRRARPAGVLAWIIEKPEHQKRVNMENADPRMDRRY
jgi:hypothetical protein